MVMHDNGIGAKSPWSIMDEYDPQLHGQPEQTSPSAARGMAIAVAIAGAGIIVGLCFIVRAAFT